MKLPLIIVLSLAFLVWGFWLVAVPETLIADRIETALKKDPVTADVITLKKGFFYDFRADLTIQRDGTKILDLDHLDAKINPFSLFLVKLPLTFQGGIAGGKITGSTDLLKNAEDAQAEVSSIQIRDIPFFHAIGLDGRGVLSGRFSMKSGAGEVTFTVNDLSVKNWQIGGVTVPLEFFSKAQGALTVGTDVITIASFTLDGEGVYARVKGNIVRGKADLTMELMPEKAFIEKTPLMLLLENYRVSPGYYAIPIKKALS